MTAGNGKIRRHFFQGLEKGNPIPHEVWDCPVVQRIESGRLERGVKTNRQHVRNLNTRHADSGGFRSVETGGDGAPPSDHLSRYIQSTLK